MKKITIYLVALFAFFFGMTNTLAVDVYNEGGVTGYDVTSNPYSCSGTNKGVFNLKDESGIRYYSALCSVDFPCSYNSSDENACVGQNRYQYTETKKCYVTCDNYVGTNVGSNQHEIWNKINTYPTGSCEADRMSEEDLQKGMDTLINNNTCRADADFYILKEYENENGSKIVSINTEIEKCDPQIKITKVCKGFSTGTFKVKVGNEEITLSCGETSSPIVVPADTPISIEELNSDGYMVYMDSKLTNGTISVGYGKTEEIVITNAVGIVELTKVNGTNGSPMEGIIFSLEKQVNGDWVKATDYNGNIIGDMRTNTDGKLSFSGLLTGKYRVVEVSNSTGNYVVSDIDEFEIANDTIDENYKMNIYKENNPFKLRLKKVDSLGNALSGAVFMIQKLDKDGIPETISEVPIENGEIDIYLEKTGYYIISEIQAPVGYDILNVPIEINLKNGELDEYTIDTRFVTVSEENNLLEIKVTNDKSKIKIYKRDSATGNIISGAKLALKRSDGTLVNEFVTMDGTFTVELAPGNYVLSEIEAPKGYETLKDNFEFIVKEDGTIEAVTNSISYSIEGMSINVFNVKPTEVPDTGIGLNILLTVIGLSLLGGGSYIVYKNVKKSKNDK